MKHRLKIGLALGGGAARGWAHLGVLQYLDEVGIEPDIICGTSIGSIVAGAVVAGKQREFTDWAKSLDWQDIVGLLDLNLSGGLMKGNKLIDFFRDTVEDRDIESLDTPFGAVATDLSTGQEVWLTKGSMLDAVRASIALPGLLTPSEHEGRWLVDGGLVNPVPVSLCRALGADYVIAVDLNAHILSKRAPRQQEQETPALDDDADEVTLGELFRNRNWRGLFDATIGGRTDEWKEYLLGREQDGPSMVDVLAQSVYIMQMRISRARMAGDPPDVLLTPRLAHIRLMDFHRTDESMKEGYNVAKQADNALRAMLEDRS